MWLISMFDRRRKTTNKDVNTSAAALLSVTAERGSLQSGVSMLAVVRVRIGENAVKQNGLRKHSPTHNGNESGAARGLLR